MFHTFQAEFVGLRWVRYCIALAPFCIARLDARESFRKWHLFKPILTTSSPPPSPPHPHSHSCSQEKFMESYFESQRDLIFRNVEVLIYVFDVESKEKAKDMAFFQSCLEAIAANSKNAHIFCLIHKMDVLKTDQERQRVRYFYFIFFSCFSRRNTLLVSVRRSSMRCRAYFRRLAKNKPSSRPWPARSHSKLRAFKRRFGMRRSTRYAVRLLALQRDVCGGDGSCKCCVCVCFHSPRAGVVANRLLAHAQRARARIAPRQFLRNHWRRRGGRL